MRLRPIAGLETALLIAGARNAAAQSLADDGAPIPGKIGYYGMAGGGFIPGSPGLAASGILALEWKRLVVSAEVGLGETFSGWDRFRAGGQAVAFLLPDADAPYFLAGAEQGTFVGGYAFRRPHGGRQLWFGARGLIPIAPHAYNAAAPQFPVVEFMAKLLL